MTSVSPRKCTLTITSGGTRKAALSESGRRPWSRGLSGHEGLACSQPFHGEARSFRWGPPGAPDSSTGRGLRLCGSGLKVPWKLGSGDLLPPPRSSQEEGSVGGGSLDERRVAALEKSAGLQEPRRITRNVGRQVLVGLEGGKAREKNNVRVRLKYGKK
nr:PREDICTED: uncharacterized protein LOC107128823 [Macaca fascicularis]